MKEFIVDGRETSIAVYRRTYPMLLLARVIGSNHMLAPILQPFYGTSEPHGCDQDKNVFGINLATDSESATNMAFIKVNPGCAPSKHARQGFAIPMRNLCGAV